MIFHVVRFFLWVGSKYLKGRNLSSDQMNGNCLNLIFARCDRNCCTMEKIRCPNSSVNEKF